MVWEQQLGRYTCIPVHSDPRGLKVPPFLLCQIAPWLLYGKQIWVDTPTYPHILVHVAQKCPLPYFVKVPHGCYMEKSFG